MYRVSQIRLGKSHSYVHQLNNDSLLFLFSYVMLLQISYPLNFPGDNMNYVVYIVCDKWNFNWSHNTTIIIRQLSLWRCRKKLFLFALDLFVVCFECFLLHPILCIHNLKSDKYTLLTINKLFFTITGYIDIR